MRSLKYTEIDMAEVFAFGIGLANTNPAGDVLDGVGGVINDFIIQPAEELNN